MDAALPTTPPSSAPASRSGARATTGPGVATSTGRSPAVELAGLTKRFGQLVAVDGLDLVIHPGEVVALLGPNGAGKSTTTEMILGLTRPDAGGVRVFGRTPAEATASGLVSAMLQNGALLEDASVQNMLRMVRAVQAHPLPLAEVVRRADIGDLLRANTGKLSGGQAQRVRYAMAIMADPELILLDEPTVAFDVDTRRRFWDDMRGFAADGRTVVFATHYLAEADEFADRVVVMRQGRVIADGTGAQVKQGVGGRVLSFHVDGPADPPTGPAPGTDPLAAWKGLPFVVDVHRSGPRIEMRSSDSDATLRAMLAMDVAVHDIEISSPTLEDAFVELTA